MARLSRATVEQAHRVGLRPCSEWLVSAALALALAAAVWGLPVGAAQRWVTLASGCWSGLNGGEPDPRLGWAPWLFAGPLVFSLGLLLAAFVVALLGWAPLGVLGPRRRGARPQMVGSVRAASPWTWIAASLAILLLARTLGGLVAGAARVVAMDPGAMGALWQSWGVRACLLTAMVSTVLGILEFQMSRAALRRGLDRGRARSPREHHALRRPFPRGARR